MLRFKMFFPAACALTLTVAACNTPQRPAAPAAGSSATASAAAAGLPADASPTGAMVAKDSPLTADQRAIVLARVGDHAITLGELEFRLAQEPLPTRSQFASVQKRKEYLASIVQFEVLAAEAKRRGLDRHPEVVEAAKQQMVRRLLIDALGDDDAPIQVSDAELRAYYDANPSLYHKPEQVEISHILLASAAQAEGVANELRTESKGSTARLVALWNERVSALSLDQTSAFCVLGAELVTTLGYAPVEAVGQAVRVGGVNHTVVGVLAPNSGGSVTPFNVNRAVLLPFAKARRSFPANPPVALFGRVGPKVDPRTVTEEIATYFRRFHRETQASVATAEQLIAKLEDQTRLFTLMAHQSQM